MRTGIGMNLPTISKAAFKARVLEILRRVEANGEAVVITDRGRPVLKLGPYHGDDDAVLASLRGSVLAYDHPTDPVGLDWKAYS